MTRMFEVRWNGQPCGVFAWFAEAEAHAREIEAEYDSVFAADERREESFGWLTLTIRSEQHGFGQTITVRPLDDSPAAPAMIPDIEGFRRFLAGDES